MLNVFTDAFLFGLNDRAEMVGRSTKDATFQNYPFYAAINKHDKRAYGIMYPGEKAMSEGLSGGIDKNIYNNKISLSKDVKRASVKNARSIFYDKMDKDQNFRRKVEESLASTQYGAQVRNKITKYNATGKRSKRLYDAFNRSLATPEVQRSGVHNEFYSALKEKGYNAILDVNDTRYSGYAGIAKSPTIFFGENNWKKIESTSVGNIRKDYAKMDSIMRKEFKKRRNKIALKNDAVVWSAAIALRERKNNRIVQDYIKEHPDTKLNDKEILKMLKKNKI